MSAVQAVLEALAIVAPAVGHTVEALVEIVRGERPDLVADPLPGLEAVDAARAEARGRAVAT